MAEKEILNVKDSPSYKNKYISQEKIIQENNLQSQR